MMKRRTWLVAVLVVLALVAALIGPASSSVRAQGDSSRVRFLHAVPGAPNVDVYFDGSLAVAGLSYGSATPHLNVAAGDHQVALRQAGSDPSAAALLEVTVPLASGLAFTVVAQGAPDALAGGLYEDILDELEPGLARLTSINTIADAPALDVLTTEGGPLLQGVGYGAQFGTVNIPAGQKDLTIVPAGGAVESAIAPVGPVSLTSGVLYTIVALGTLDGDTAPTSLVVATPVNGAADSVRVRIAHGSPDAGAVDVYANDVLLAPSLELGQMTPHIALPAGSTSLALRPAGAPPADAPAFAADVTLDAAAPAVTVVATGELGDGSLALATYPDNVADMTAESARIAVVNAVPGATATVALADEAATVLASSLAANAQGDAIDVTPGKYMLTVGIEDIDTPVDVVVPEETYAGGMYYTVLVFGGGTAAAPMDARVAATEIAVEATSLPGSGGVMVAQVPAAEPTEAPVAEATEEAPAEVTEEAPPAAEPTEEVTEVVEAPPAEPTEVVEAPPAEPAEAPAQPTDTELVIDPEGAAPSTDVSEAPPADAQAQPTAAPQPLATAQPGPIAYVELNPGANLHCREYPSATAKSLGLIPAGATLTVLGKTGEPIVPDTGDPTPEPTPVVETLEDLWLSVRWDPPTGGYLRCWVAAQYLRIEFRGQLLDELEELLQLPDEPFNLPGEAVDTDIQPPTPVYDAILATVNLDPGVSLQLRRFPKTDAEALDRVPAGAQLEVLGYVEAPSEGLVGQPVDPNWIRVRYLTENGGATVGWVSAQYVTLSHNDRPVALTDLTVLDPEEAGFYETPGQAPFIPIEQQEIMAVVLLDPGANLNLRDRPSADAFVVVGVPSGEVLTVNGRNGDGTWVRVTYETATGPLEGWVAAQYLTITQGGQPVNLSTMENVSDEPDTLTGEVAPAEPEATEVPAEG